MKHILLFLMIFFLFSQKTESQVKNGQLYKPKGMSIGDTWNLQRGDTTHVFYLQNKEKGSTRPDNDNGSIGHAISTDLINWEELPVALRSGDSNAKRRYDDGPLFTGSAIVHNDTIYLFYCGNEFINYSLDNPINRQSLCLATSSDGITFQKYSENPIAEPTKGKYYNIFEKKAPFPHHMREWVDCRDMDVIKDPNREGWLGYAVMRLQGQKDSEHSICIVLCQSEDLYHWTVGDPVCTPNRFNVFEVPNVFKMDGRWFMTALKGGGDQSPRWEEATIPAATMVFESDSPYGPFVEVKDNLLLTQRNNKTGVCAKTVERYGERLMLYNRPGTTSRWLSWPVKLVPKQGKGQGLVPIYWSGCDKAFDAKTTPNSNLSVQNKTGGLFGKKILSSDFPSNDSIYMIQAYIKANKAAGFGFGLSEDNSNVGFQVVIDPDQGPKGLTLLSRANGIVLTDRWCEISANKKHHIRLVVMGKNISFYVDNILVIDYFLEDLNPNKLSIVAKDKANFYDLDYRSGIITK